MSEHDGAGSGRELVVRLSRKKPLIHTGFALALIVMGCVVIFSKDRTMQPLIGGLMALAGVGVGVRAVGALSDASPKIIMDRDGLHLPGARLGTLGWGEISSAHIEVIRSCTYLHLRLTDPRRSFEWHPELRDRVHGEKLELDISGYDMSGEAISEAIMTGLSSASALRAA